MSKDRVSRLEKQAEKRRNLDQRRAVAKLNKFVNEKTRLCCMINPDIVYDEKIYCRDCHDKVYTLRMDAYYKKGTWHKYD